MDRPRFNLLYLGLAPRLVLAGAACVLVWAAVWWALA
jgi:hypothetical protein